MEGDGGRVLVVLQRTDYDGIFVAVVNKPASGSNRAPSSSSKHNKLEGSRSCHKASVKTNTDFPRTKADKQITAHDDRFTSSYQVDHCRACPSAPLNRVSEFPPQRPNARHNESHFVVGDQHLRTHDHKKKSTHFRGGLTWPDRGSVYCKEPSRDTDAFAHSLRKYPMSSPLSSTSKELLDKFVKRTQKIAEKIPRTKSTSILQSDKTPYSIQTKPSKHAQTYTRTRNVVQNRVNVPAERQGRSATRQGEKKPEEPKKRTKYRTHSPASTSAKLKNKSSDYNVTYEYLKTASPPRVEPLRPADVRKQLNNMIKHVYHREPFVFQLCPNLRKRLIKQHKPDCPLKSSEIFQVCQNIRKRYIKHKNDCPYQEKSSDIIFDNQEKGSQPLLYRLLELISNECDTPCSSQDLAKLCDDKKNCPCSITPLCKCEASEPVQKGANCIWYPQHSCICEAADKEYYFNKICQEVSDWLNDIPVQANECPENIKIRIELAKELVDTIVALPDDNNFEKMTRKAIEKCLNKMPMWNPGTEHEKMMFKKQLVESLLDKVLSIPRHPNKLKDAVTKFVNALKLKEGANRQAIIDDMFGKIKFFAANAPLHEKECKDLLVTEIIKILREIPINYYGDKNLLIESLANNLAEDILDDLECIDIIHGKEPGDDRLKEVFKNDIHEWINEFGEFKDNLPSESETKLIIDNLAGKLDKLQSQGMDEAVRNKMENEINTVLEGLDITGKAKENLTAKLMDRVTDTVYAKGKDNQAKALKQKTFDEVKKWLEGIEAVDELNDVELYKLAKDITDKIEKAKREENDNYENDILASFENAGVSVDPRLINKQIEEIINKVNTLPEEVKRDEFKDKILEHFNEVISKTNMPKDKKDALMKKIEDVVTANMEKSLLTSKGDMDEMKEILLEHVDNVIMQDPNIPDDIKELLKNNLTTVLDQNFDNLTAATDDKDVAKFNLMKEINNLIDREPIPDEIKRDLKYRIKHIVDEKLDKPFSNHLLDTITDNIHTIINEADIDQAAKDKLSKKLTNVATKNLDKLPKQTMKDHIKDKIIKAIHTQIDNAPIPEEVKNEFKQNLKFALKDQFDQAFTKEIKNDITEKIKELVESMPIAKTVKDSILNNISSALTENLDEIPFQTPIDHVKDVMMTEAANVLNELGLPKDQLKEVKNEFLSAITDALDRPYTAEERKKLEQKIYDNVAKLDIPSNKKQILTEKLLDIVANKLDKIPFQTKEEYGKTELIKYFEEFINDLSIPSNEKATLIKKFLNEIDECIGEDLTTNREKVADLIEKLLRGSAIPEEEQDALINKVKRTADKILDEAYYTDDIRAYLHDINKSINASGLTDDEKVDLKAKVKKMADEIAHDPEFMTKKLQITKDLDLENLPPGPPDADLQERIRDIIYEIRRLPVAIEKKTALINKITELAEDVQENEDLNKLLKKVTKDIEALPMPSKDKRALQTKLAIIVAPNSEAAQQKIKDTLLSEVDAVIDQIALSKDKKKDLRKKLMNFIANIEAPISDDFKDKLKTEMNKIIDENVFSKDKKADLKSKIANVLDTLPIPEGASKDKVIKLAGDIIDAAAIRQHLKDDLKLEIEEILSKLYKEPFKVGAKAKAIKDITTAIDVAPITKYQKDALRRKLIEVITRELDKVPDLGSDGVDGLLANAYEVIDSAPLSKAEKSELKDKVKQMLATSPDLSSPEGKAKTIQKIFDALDNSALTKEQKANLKAKLENVVTAYQPPPQPSAQAEALMSKMYEQIDAAPISREMKMKLKKQLTDSLNECLDKPMDIEQLQELVNEKITDIINDSPLTRAEKEELRNNLINTAIEEFHKDETGSEKKDGGWPRSERETSFDTNLATKEAIKARFSSIINKLDIPEHAKAETKTELAEYLDDNESKLILRGIAPSGINIGNILHKLPLPKDVQAEAKTELMEAITREVPTSLSKAREASAAIWKKLEDVVRVWIDDLPVTLSSKVKESLMKDIASDMADRQKYLQLFPDAMKSVQGELDNIQYQVISRLRKVLDDKSMAKVMQHGGLMEALKSVDIPEHLLAGQPRPSDAGRAFRQDLRHLPSDIFPDISDLTAAEQTIFELLKEDLIDAFMDLNYTGGTDEERAKLRKRISDEVDKFCDEYLKTHPTETLDRKLIKEKLYTILRNIPLPDGSIISESSKIRNKINDFINEFQLDDLTPEQRAKINDELVKLEDNLKQLYQSERGLPDSMMEMKEKELFEEYREKINSMIERAYCQKCCRRHRRMSICRPISPCVSIKRQPPCSISKEDREHLKRIKDRTCKAPNCLSSLLIGKKRNASVCPMAVDCSCQTDEVDPMSRRSSLRPCTLPRSPTCESVLSICRRGVRCQGSQSDNFMEMTPKVIVRKYEWDSVDTDQQTPCSPRPCEPRPCEPRPCEPRPCDPRPCDPRPCDYPEVCPRRRGTWSVRPRQKPSIPSQPVGTCWSCASSPKPSPPITCRNSLTQTFHPQSHSTPRNSDPFTRYDNGFKRRDSLSPENGEASNTRFSGQFKPDLLSGMQRSNQNIRFSKDLTWSPEISEDDYEEFDDFNEEPCRRHESCRRHEMPSCFNRCTDPHRYHRPCCHGHYNVYRGEPAKRRSQCFEIHCPFPSNRYFK